MPGAASPRGPLRLFPTEVLRRIAQGPAPGSAPPPPSSPGGRRGPASEGAEIQQRIQGWIADSVGRDRIRTGDLPPRWRLVERHAAELFTPPAAVVRGQNRVLALAGQILKSAARVRSLPLRRGEQEHKTAPGTPEGMNLSALPLAQTAVLQAAWEDPNAWRTTELEMFVEASGDIAALRVVVGSGSAQLDRLAMAAVREAARQNPGRGEPAVLRWIVRSAISVVPPDRVGLSFDENALFDRKRHFISNVRAPFMEKVYSDVQLESYQPRKEQPAPAPP